MDRKNRAISRHGVSDGRLEQELFYNYPLQVVLAQQEFL